MQGVGVMSMDELKPCPFCGSEAHLYVVEYSCVAAVGCVNCHISTLYYPLFEEGKKRAVAAWNTRAERTCHMEYNEDWSGDELYPTEAYQCSECGRITQEGLPNYCPSCGAKVVDE